jgi:23S rRNA (cytidine1920-2'-O)/16S rRNA (cytidine1409-2'-O)-methyltransferase
MDDSVPTRPFVSRAGAKLDHALKFFGFDVTGKFCADLGCSTGGFTDCLLQHGAAKVFAVDTGYGVLDWKLRTDARVVVMERTNAMHVNLPKRVDVVTIDVAWTRQRHILPNVRGLLVPDGRVIALIKPHYEAQASQLKKGILIPDQMPGVLKAVEADITVAGFVQLGIVESPIKGAKGNTELLALLRLNNEASPTDISG